MSDDDEKVNIETVEAAVLAAAEAAGHAVPGDASADAAFEAVAMEAAESAAEGGDPPPKRRRTGGRKTIHRWNDMLFELLKVSVVQ